MQRQTPSTTAIALVDEHLYENFDSEIDNLNIMNDWHSEWATAPQDPLPSNLNRLFLLNNPARINLKLHPQKARRASLIHYAVGFVPEGRLQQEKQWAHEKRDLHHKQGAEKFVRDMERSQKRRKVAMAANEADAIDVMGNEFEGGRTHRPQPQTATTHQYRQSDDDVPATGSSRSAATREMSSASAGLHENDGLVALPTAWTTSTPFQQQQRPRPQYQPATSVQPPEDFFQFFLVWFRTPVT
jgi:hypothetical protein